MKKRLFLLVLAAALTFSGCGSVGQIAGKTDKTGTEDVQKMMMQMQGAVKTLQKAEVLMEVSHQRAARYLRVVTVMSMKLR